MENDPIGPSSSLQKRKRDNTYLHFSSYFVYTLAITTTTTTHPVLYHLYIYYRQARRGPELVYNII
jgi:hypothetical protein